MRIIGGTARGRSIHWFQDARLRPMTDRLKESIFDILGDSVAGASVLDLFAGTGSLGLEALSRGAARCVFVDNRRRCTDTIRKNLSLLGFEDRSLVVQADVFRLLRRTFDPGYRFELVFVDPPYAMTDDAVLASALYAALDEAAPSLLAPEATVLLRRKSRAPAFAPLRFLHEEQSRTYAESEITFFLFGVPGAAPP